MFSRTCGQNFYEIYILRFVFMSHGKLHSADFLLPQFYKLHKLTISEFP